MTMSGALATSATSNPDTSEPGTWAVVPVKVLGEAKRRLHGCLGEHREPFALAMLEDVFKALADSRLVDRVVCVTADPRVASLADRNSVLVVDEREPRGMNGAIGLGIETARSQGAQRVVVLPADLPFASGPEIDRLITTVDQADTADGAEVIGLSPAADRKGTNFLSLNAAKPFNTCFGPDSFRQHQQCAEIGGFRALLLESKALSFDIDCEQDLLHLVSYGLQHPQFQSGTAWKYICRNGLAGAPKPMN